VEFANEECDSVLLSAPSVGEGDASAAFISIKEESIIENVATVDTERNNNEAAEGKNLEPIVYLFARSI
jgi:hypothetical protein